MLAVFDAYLSIWKHSLHVSYFISLLLHEPAIFRWDAKETQNKRLPLIAPSRGSNSLSFVAMRMRTT